MRCSLENSKIYYYNSAKVSLGFAKWHTIRKHLQMHQNVTCRSDTCKTGLHVCLNCDFNPEFLEKARIIKGSQVILKALGLEKQVLSFELWHREQISFEIRDYASSVMFWDVLHQCCLPASFNSDRSWEDRAFIPPAESLVFSKFQPFSSFL